MAYQYQGHYGESDSKTTQGIVLLALSLAFFTFLVVSMVMFTVHIKREIAEAQQEQDALDEAARAKTRNDTGCANGTTTATAADAWQGALTKLETRVVVKTPHARSKRRRARRLDFTIPHARRRMPRTRDETKHRGGNGPSLQSTGKSVPPKPPQHDAVTARWPRLKVGFKDHTETKTATTTTTSTTTKTTTRATTAAARSTTNAAGVTTGAPPTASSRVATTTRATTVTTTTRATTAESSTTTTPTAVTSSPTRHTGAVTPSPSPTTKRTEATATGSASAETTTKATPATEVSAGTPSAEVSSKTWSRAIIKALSVNARGPVSTDVATQSPPPLTRKIIAARGVIRGVKAVTAVAQRAAGPSKRVTSHRGTRAESRASSTPQNYSAAPKLDATSPARKATTSSAASTAVQENSPAIPTRRKAASGSPGTARQAG